MFSKFKTRIAKEQNIKNICVCAVVCAGIHMKKKSMFNSSFFFEPMLKLMRRYCPVEIKK